MTEARELTPEQIAPALAEARGLTKEKPSFNHGMDSWINNDGIRIIDISKENPLVDWISFNKLTLDPEIHAGMIGVLDEWFYRTDGIRTLAEWWHNPEYLQDIRLWQLRAVVEFLRRRGK